MKASAYGSDKAGGGNSGVENVKSIGVFTYDKEKKYLRKEFEITCNDRNTLGSATNWPPADIKFDDMGKRLIIVNK